MLLVGLKKDVVVVVVATTGWKVKLLSKFSAFKKIPKCNKGLYIHTYKLRLDLMMRYVLPDWPVCAAILVLYFNADYENINLARKAKTAKA